MATRHWIFQTNHSFSHVSEPWEGSLDVNSDPEEVQVGDVAYFAKFSNGHYLLLGWAGVAGTFRKDSWAGDDEEAMSYDGPVNIYNYAQFLNPVIFRDSIAIAGLTDEERSALGRAQTDADDLRDTNLKIGLDLARRLNDQIRACGYPSAPDPRPESPKLDLPKARRVGAVVTANQETSCSMSRIFISHVEEDAAAALEVATGLEAAGFCTWYYERDSVPGVSYLVQVGDAIEQAAAVVVFVSRASLGSHQITTEIVRAYETAKPILPITVDVNHGEFQRRQPEWRTAIGAATSISLNSRGVAGVVAALASGLRRLAITPIENKGTVGPAAATDVSEGTAAERGSSSGQRKSSSRPESAIFEAQRFFLTVLDETRYKQFSRIGFQRLSTMQLPLQWHDYLVATGECRKETVTLHDGRCVEIVSAILFCASWDYGGDLTNRESEQCASLAVAYAAFRSLPADQRESVVRQFAANARRPFAPIPSFDEIPAGVVATKRRLTDFAGLFDDVLAIEWANSPARFDISLSGSSEWPSERPCDKSRLEELARPWSIHFSYLD